MTQLSLVCRDAQDTIARVNGRNISVGAFCADVERVAEQLPAASHLVNVCVDRYRFMVSFFAAITKGQITLLPGQRDEKTARALQQNYSGSEIVTDESLELDPGTHGQAPSPEIPANQSVAIAFTSGSTGEPQAHLKTWAMLAQFRAVHAHLLDLEQPAGLVATVPSWHMYGLEWAMMLPTVAPLTIFCGADFYPQDVRGALDEYGPRPVLVSTPLHLRALIKGAAPINACGTVVCATAPLDAQLAQRVEEQLRGRLLEIYGCSEIGSLASRLPTLTPAWQFFDCFEVAFDAGEIAIGHVALQAPLVLADAFDQLDDATPNAGYVLQGRAGDVVKVGGKRESLARLNSLLCSLDGVEDGVFYRPADFGLAPSERLAAVVVTELDRHALRKALSQSMETVFVPRPIHVVDALPRDHTSKLKRADFEKVVRTLHTATPRGHGSSDGSSA